MKTTIYTLPHGIEIVGEYLPRGASRYWRVRIRPHPFFPELKVVGGGCYIRRSRAVMASILGRALSVDEIVHHANEDRNDDSPGNLELTTAAAHNSHHKTGSTHSSETKKRISRGLRKAIAEGRRSPPPTGHWKGRSHRHESKKKLSATRKRLISSGDIDLPTPPSWVGKKHSAETREKMRQARLAFWSSKKGKNA